MSALADADAAGGFIFHALRNDSEAEVSCPRDEWPMNRSRGYDFRAVTAV